MNTQDTNRIFIFTYGTDFPKIHFIFAKLLHIANKVKQSPVTGSLILHGFFHKHLQIGTALTSDYIKVFQMWEVHEQVISNLNLPYNYTYMRQHLTVSNDSNTRMLDITFRSPSPEEAASVANEYAKMGSQFIADTMSTDKPNIMSVALVPSVPVSPNKTRNILLGFVLGSVLACGLVTVQFLMDDKYKTAEDIRRYTGLATLAVIPVEDSMTGKEKKHKKSSRREA